VRSVYVETTVVSYYTARPSRDLIIAAHQEATHELWPKLVSEYESYVSVLVREEAAKGDEDQAVLRLRAVEAFPVLDSSEEAKTLASKILDGRAVPRECPEDASHIAIAAVNGMDVLATWNFAHLNNPRTRSMIRRVVEDAGYRCPEICSPDELLEEIE